MKHWLMICSFWYLGSVSSYAQSCDCKIVAKLLPQTQDNIVRLWLDELQKLYPNFKKQGYKLKVLPSNCSLAMAMLCGKDNYYILYNQSLLKAMNQKGTWSERFVLAHEWAHILYGHAFKLKVMGQYYAPETYQDKYKKTVWLPLGSHLEEFQADGLAAFIVRELGAKSTDIQQVFEALTAVTPLDAGTKSTNSHPSHQRRRQYIQQVWEAYNQGQLAVANSAHYVANKSIKFYENYLQQNEGILEASERKALESLQKWREDFDGKRGIANDLARAGKFERALQNRLLLDSLYKSREWHYVNEREVEENEAKIKKYKGLVNTKAVYGLFLSSTLSSAFSTFKTPNQVSLPIQYGLAVNRLRWYNPSSYELKIGVWQQQWQTFLDKENTLKEEYFRLKTADIALSYTYRSIASNNSSAKFYAKGAGWFVNAGAGLAFPLRFDFQNTRLNQYFEGKNWVNVSPYPTVSVGYEKLNRRVLNGHFQVAINWQLKRLVLKDLPTKEPIGFHQIGLELKGRIL